MIHRAADGSIDFAELKGEKILFNGLGPKLSEIETDGIVTELNVREEEDCLLIQIQIENCFVRDVNINVTTPINNGRIGGFAGFVTPYNTNHVVKNCYSLNVRFSENGTDTVGYGFGHFVGLTESNAAFINCYSGGVPQKPDVYSNSGKVLPFGLIKGTIVTNCYSDCYPDAEKLAWFLSNGFTNAVPQIDTAKLKGMTDGVALGTGFVKAENDIYNYGYPFLKWEEKYIEDIRQPQPTGAFEIVNHEQTEDQK